MKLASIAALALMVALTSGAVSAKQKRHEVTRVAEPAHVACTKYGCYPVPSNCVPHTQLDWRGNPTGYDAIACR